MSVSQWIKQLWKRDPGKKPEMSGSDELQELIDKTLPSRILWSASTDPIPLIMTDTPIHNKKQLQGTDVNPVFQAFLKNNDFALFAILDFPKLRRQLVFELFDPDRKKLQLFFAMTLKLKHLNFNDEPILSTGISIPIINSDSLVDTLKRVRLF